MKNTFILTFLNLTFLTLPSYAFTNSPPIYATPPSIKDYVGGMTCTKKVNAGDVIDGRTASKAGYVITANCDTTYTKFDYQPGKKFRTIENDIEQISGGREVSCAYDKDRKPFNCLVKRTFAAKTSLTEKEEKKNDFGVVLPVDAQGKTITKYRNITASQTATEYNYVDGAFKLSGVSTTVNFHGTAGDDYCTLINGETTGSYSEAPVLQLAFARTGLRAEPNSQDPKTGALNYMWSPKMPDGNSSLHPRNIPGTEDCLYSTKLTNYKGGNNFIILNRTSDEGGIALHTIAGAGIDSLKGFFRTFGKYGQWPKYNDRQEKVLVGNDYGTGSAITLMHDDRAEIKNFGKGFYPFRKATTKPPYLIFTTKQSVVMSKTYGRNKATTANAMQKVGISFQNPKCLANSQVTNKGVCYFAVLPLFFADRREYKDYKDDIDNQSKLVCQDASKTATSSSAYACLDSEGNPTIGNKVSLAQKSLLPKNLYNVRYGIFRGDPVNKNSYYFNGYLFKYRNTGTGSGTETFFCDKEVTDRNCEYAISNPLPLWESLGAETQFAEDSIPMTLPNGQIKARFQDQTFKLKIDFNTHFKNMLKIIAASALTGTNTQEAIKPSSIDDEQLLKVFGEAPTPANWKIPNLSFGQEVYNPNEDADGIDKDSVIIAGNLKTFTIEGF